MKKKDRKYYGTPVAAGKGGFPLSKVGLYVCLCCICLAVITLVVAVYYR